MNARDAIRDEEVARTDAAWAVYRDGRYGSSFSGEYLTEKYAFEAGFVAGREGTSHREDAK